MQSVGSVGQAPLWSEGPGTVVPWSGDVWWSLRGPVRACRRVDVAPEKLSVSDQCALGDCSSVQNARSCAVVSPCPRARAISTPTLC